MVNSMGLGSVTSPMVTSDAAPAEATREESLTPAMAAPANSTSYIDATDLPAFSVGRRSAPTLPPPSNVSGEVWRSTIDRLGFIDTSIYAVMAVTVEMGSEQREAARAEAYSAMQARVNEQSAEAEKIRDAAKDQMIGGVSQGTLGMISGGVGTYGAIRASGLQAEEPPKPDNTKKTDNSDVELPIEELDPNLPPSPDSEPFAVPAETPALLPSRPQLSTEPAPTPSATPSPAPASSTPEPAPPAQTPTTRLRDLAHLNEGAGDDIPNPGAKTDPNNPLKDNQARLDKLDKNISPFFSQQKQTNEFYKWQSIAQIGQGAGQVVNSAMEQQAADDNAEKTEIEAQGIVDETRQQSANDHYTQQNNSIRDQMQAIDAIRSTDKEASDSISSGMRI